MLPINCLSWPIRNWNFPVKSYALPSPNVRKNTGKQLPSLSSTNSLVCLMLKDKHLLNVKGQTFVKRQRKNVCQTSRDKRLFNVKGQTVDVIYLYKYKPSDFCLCKSCPLCIKQITNVSSCCICYL